MNPTEHRPEPPPLEPPRRDRRVEVGILLLCLLLRGGMFLGVAPWRESVRQGVLLREDMAGYHLLAVNLLEAGRLHSPAWPEGDTLRTPGYPAFLAGVYAVFGTEPAAALGAQALLEVLSCGLLMAAVATATTRRAARWAGLLYAVDPAMIVFSSALLSESLLAVLVCGGLATLAWGLQTGRARTRMAWMAATGALWGAGALVRPVLLFAPVAAVAALLIVVRPRLRAALPAAAMCVAFMATVGPWLVRNGLHYGTPSLSTAGEYNLLVLHAAPLISAETGEPLETVQQRLLGEAAHRAKATDDDPAPPADPGPFRLADSQRTLAGEIIAERPAAYARLYLRGVAKTLLALNTRWYSRQLGLPTGGKFDDEPTTAARGPRAAAREWFRGKSAAEIALGVAIAAESAIVYLAAAAGLVLGLRNRDTRAWTALCAAMTLYVLAVTGPAGLGRFKVPAIPFLLALAGRALAASRRGAPPTAAGTPADNPPRR